MTAGDARAPSIADLPPPRGWREAAGDALRPLARRLEGLAEAERTQLPLWLPVGLGLGTSAWFALPDARAWTAFALLAAAAMLIPVALAPGSRWGRALSIFCLAALIGCGNAWWKAERLRAPVVAREHMARFDGRIEALQRLPAREAVRLVVAPDAGAGLPLRLRINVEKEAAAEGLRPGQRVRLKVWLMPPAPAAVPGAYDFARAAWFQRIGGTGRAIALERLPGEGGLGWSARLADVRQRLAEHIRSRLSGGAGGIATALATGDQSGISEQDADAMRRSGLAHLLSVSGLHLTAVVAAVMLAVLKLLALSRTLALRLRLVLVAAGAGALAGIAYTLLTGAEVPTVRACIASLLVLLGIALGREALTLRLVAVGALAVLLLWPESLVGPSFQMSFAAITAIVALHEQPRLRAFLARRDEPWFVRLGRGTAGLVLTGLAVEVALVPIALWHFHRTGLYGAFANILAIPLTTFVVMPLEAAALLLDPLGLGGPFWTLTGAALRLLLRLAYATAAAPGAVALLPTMPAAAFAAMAAGGLWLALWRTRWRRWGLVPIAAGAAAAALSATPDLLVTGDGRHLALRTDQGALAILRGRAGDYVRDTLSESAGMEAEFLDLDALAGADCSPDFCLATLNRGGRPWRLLASRSQRLIDIDALSRACAAADIVVSERRLPAACRPAWLKADATLLARTGGLAIYLEEGEPRVATVAGTAGRHPWVQPPAADRHAPRRAL